MGLFKKASVRRESVYQTFKDVVIAMQEAGTCSPEETERLMRALDFALFREGTLQQVHWTLKYTPVTFADWRVRLGFTALVFFILARFGFGISWLTSACVSLLSAWVFYSLLLTLEHLLKLLARVIDIATYSLALRIAENRSIPLYEARTHVEAMRHVDLDFEGPFLSRDTHFPYQISDACLWKGDCEKCDGTTMGRVSGDSRCLHKCHQASQTVAHR